MMSEKLLYEEKYDEAIEILKSCYKTHEEKGYSVAIPSIGLANAYAFMGNTELQKKYLAISDSSDYLGQEQRRNTYSLWKLANLLFQEGDIKRTYTYIRMFYARCHPSAMHAIVRRRFGTASRYQPDERKQVEAGENTNGCPRHSHILYC